MPSASPRSLTVRAMLVALAIVLVTTVLVDFHDGNIAQRNLTMHDYMAPLAVGVLFVVTVLNAVLRRVAGWLALRSGEMAIAAALVLIVAPIPRFVAPALVGTIGYTRAFIENKHPSTRDLQRANPYAVLPDRATLASDDSRRFEGTLPGLAPGELASPAAVPWGVWLRPLAFWAPLMLVFLTLSISFAFVLYRQWAYRELVPFPLAEFIGSLVRHEQKRAAPDVFYKPSFWIGLGIIVVIFGCNGLHAHFEKMIDIPTKFNYYALSQTFPFLKFSHEGYSLLRGTLWFTVIAAAFLLQAELSFTAWFTWPLMIVGSYLYYLQTGERYGGNENAIVQTGAWWAMAALLIYAGRTQYMALLRAAFGLHAKEEVDRQSLWAFRIFLASAIGLVVVLWAHGLAIDLAVVWVLCLVMMFLVVCRLVTEMGLPWTPFSGASPLSFLLAAVGETALGAKMYSLLAIFSNVAFYNNNTMLTLPPAALNAAHIESQNTGGNHSVRVVAPFVLVALVLAVGTLIWLGYSHEGSADDVYRFEEVAAAARGIAPILADRVATAPPGMATVELINEPLSFTQRWSAARPAPGFVGFFLFGFAIVMLTGFARLKMPRFPLHPLPLVLVGSWLLSRFWLAFLIGWLLKKTILKIGGGRLFDRCRPFFTGVVIGQTVIVTVWVVANIFIYWNNGSTFDRRWWEFMTDIYSG